MAALSGGSLHDSSEVLEGSFEDRALHEYSLVLEQIALLIIRSDSIKPSFVALKADLKVLQRAINVMRSQDGSSPVSVKEYDQPFDLESEVLKSRLTPREYRQLLRAQSWLQLLKARNYPIHSVASGQWATLRDADLAYDELRHFAIEDEAFLEDAVETLLQEGAFRANQAELIYSILSFFETNPYPVYW
jgi:hypothetical protein